MGSGLGQGRTGQEFDEPIVVGWWPNRVVAWNPCAAKTIPLYLHKVKQTDPMESSFWLAMIK